jgi:hypothetical protein
MMDYELKRIGLRNLFKLSFVFYAILGCVFGFVLLAMGKFVGILENPPAALPFLRIPPSLQGYLGFFIVLVSAVAYGIIGAAFLSVGATIYNVFASWLGGLRIELSAVEKEE